MKKNLSAILAEHAESAQLIATTASEKRKNNIADLFALRKRAERLLANAKKNVVLRRDELAKVNETICEVQGHSFTDWEMKDGILDRSWIYTRSCTVCGFDEQTEIEPAEYKEQQRKARAGH